MDNRILGDSNSADIKGTKPKEGMRENTRMKNKIKKIYGKTKERARENGSLVELMHCPRFQRHQGDLEREQDFQESE
jgi:hypothetical protein